MYKHSITGLKCFDVGKMDSRRKRREVCCNKCRKSEVSGKTCLCQVPKEVRKTELP